MIRNSLQKLFVRISPKQKWSIAVLLGFITWYTFFLLPKPLFKDPNCTILEDKNGRLLAASIAKDGQWRFPLIDTVPQKFETCLLYFEDQYFYKHPGVNPVSMGRALIQNVSQRKKISGGSTITMQVVRLARKGQSRNIYEKLIETIWATRVELAYSKKDILRQYCTYAPFGSNVVGLEAASWRYFGRKPATLSWAESALLAVLPNSPSLIYPGKNQEILLKKRNRLLKKLKDNQIIDALTYSLAVIEKIPGSPHSLPQYAPHLLSRARSEGFEGQRIVSTLNVHLQQRADELINRYHEFLKDNGVFNACAIILDIKTGKTLAYIGNTRVKEKEHGGYVDITTAQRSYGSLLKPFLYASALDAGLITPQMLLADYPVMINGYNPQNFFGTFDGAVPANFALSRSLNVPFVRLLQNYGNEKFLYKIQKAGLVSLNKSAHHYGLSIILGGGESNLWEMTGAYASMARCLNNRSEWIGNYDYKDFHPPVYIATDTAKTYTPDLKTEAIISYASLWTTMKALLDVKRPGLETNWMEFGSANHISWKTGTSFGFRDAWSIGVTGNYAVGVWVGNADGEGRAGLTGVSTAAPIMFELFGLLPKSSWFKEPVDGMAQMIICRQSGMRATSLCQPVDTLPIPKTCLIAPSCSYHQLIHLDKNQLLRVTGQCESVNNMDHKSWFVLPAVMEYYYKKNNPTYLSLPPYRSDCALTAEQRNMDFIYPKNNTKLYIPKELDGNIGKTVFEVAHRKPQTKVYWHLDDSYIGVTQHFHQIPLSPETGKHRLSIVDENGEAQQVFFEIISNN